MDSIEAKSIVNNTISAADAVNSGIIHNPGVCDDNSANNPIFTSLKIPTLDDDKEGDDDYSKESDDSYDDIEQVKNTRGRQKTTGYNIEWWWGNHVIRGQ